MAGQPRAVLSAMSARPAAVEDVHRAPCSRWNQSLPTTASARLAVVDEDQLAEYERWQNDIEAYTDRLVDAVVASGQYAGSEIRHATREFIIFAVGEPSPQVAAIRDQAPDNVRIIWRGAPYTRAELTSEMQRIMSRFRGRLTSGGAANDGTGIQFTTTDTQLLEAPDPQAVLGSRYPVTIGFMESPVEH